MKFVYNVYSFINKNYLLHLMIGEHKENQNAAGKISFINKIKFIFYFLGSIISLIFVFLELYFLVRYNKRNGKSIICLIITILTFKRFSVILAILFFIIVPIIKTKNSKKSFLILCFGNTFNQYNIHIADIVPNIIAIKGFNIKNKLLINFYFFPF